MEEDGEENQTRDFRARTWLSELVGAALDLPADHRDTFQYLIS